MWAVVEVFGHNFIQLLIGFCWHKRFETRHLSEYPLLANQYNISASVTVLGTNTMIIRWWRAVAGTDEVLNQYADHLMRTTFVEMAQLPGHLGASLAVKIKGTDNELVVTSLWSDLASAAHFEKGEFDDAVVKPSTQKLLKSFDLKVEYFEAVVSTGKLAHES